VNAQGLLLSVPYEIRWLLAAKAEVLSAVLRIFARTVSWNEQSPSRLQYGRYVNFRHFPRNGTMLVLPIRTQRSARGASVSAVSAKFTMQTAKRKVAGPRLLGLLMAAFGGAMGYLSLSELFEGEEASLMLSDQVFYNSSLPDQPLTGDIDAIALLR